MAKAPTNLTESNQYGDEELVEVGRRFDAIARQAQVTAEDDDEGFGYLLGVLNLLIAEGARLRATTERGVAVKARMAFYLNESSRGSVVTMDRGRDKYPLYDIFHSLLSDMVPPEHQRVV